jgi:hypothetical protein
LILFWSCRRLFLPAIYSMQPSPAAITRAAADVAAAAATARLFIGTGWHHDLQNSLVFVQTREIAAAKWRSKFQLSSFPSELMISSGRMSLLWNKLDDGAQLRIGPLEPGDHLLVQKLLVCDSQWANRRRRWIWRAARCFNFSNCLLSEASICRS